MTAVKAKFVLPLADDSAWDPAHLRKVTGYGHGSWAEPGDEVTAILVEPELWLVAFRWSKAMTMTTEAAKAFLKSEARVEMDATLEQHVKNYQFMKEHPPE